jgi:hypothetical protein
MNQKFNTICNQKIHEKMPLPFIVLAGKKLFSISISFLASRKKRNNDQKAKQFQHNIFKSNIKNLPR